MRINNNLMAMNTHRQLGAANAGGAKSMEKLSSGLRINRAGDDAAGLAISEKMRGQIRGLNQASSNAQDGISLIQTAEGALNETHAILQRMRELAVQSSTDTNTNADRGEIQKEVDQLSSELTRIAETTQFNTMNLLDGSFADKKFHIGANTGQNTTIDVSNMDAVALKVAEAAYTVDVTISGIADGGEAIPEGEYAIVTADEFEGTEVTDATHYLVDADGEAVASSANGTLFTGVGAATAPTFSVGENAIKVNVTSDTTATVTYAADFGEGQSLAGGTYKVVTVEGVFELQNLAGETVAYSETTDGKVWTSDVEGKNVIMTTEALTNGNTTTIASGGIDVSNQAAADSAITTINTALETVSGERSKLGAMQNRLEHTIKNLDTSAENLQASEARIRDVDMAKEMMEFTKQNILTQASTAMLAQANAAPQTVLQLLR